jgi:CHAT domain-containing protein
VGTEAREDRFKLEAGDYRIIHLATHAILNNRSPMYSHVVLAQTAEESKEDGLLEAWELMNLDLKAELAVLSACETARGRLSKGEGMIGLTWALFVAGVPKAVVSQWKVRSDSTAELMVEFHRQLNTTSTESGRHNSAAEALRAAALKVKGDRRYRHPFHWAGFVVVGDGY